LVFLFIVSFGLFFFVHDQVRKNPYKQYTSARNDRRGGHISLVAPKQKKETTAATTTTSVTSNTDNDAIEQTDETTTESLPSTNENAVSTTVTEKKKKNKKATSTAATSSSMISTTKLEPPQRDAQGRRNLFMELEQRMLALASTIPADSLDTDGDLVTDMMATGVDHESQQRRSTHIEAAMILANLVQRNLKALAFTKVRSVCELVTLFTHHVLNSDNTTRHLTPLVQSYRGGYSAEARRSIETHLFAGALRAAVSTNALELGVDIGSLDATLHIGFPGSIASLWQQAGRSGRSSRPSLSILIAYDSPLDQYFMAHPLDLFHRSSERAVLNPDNMELLRKHMMAAAFEQPLVESRDAPYFGLSLYRECVTELLAKGMLLTMAGHKPGAPDELTAVMSAWTDALPSTSSSGTMFTDTQRQRRRLDCQQRGPAMDIAIRNCGDRHYRVVDVDTNTTLDEIDESRAFFFVHPGAIYLHQSRAYVVVHLDMKQLMAKVKTAAVFNFYTKPRDHTDVFIISRRKLDKPSSIQTTPSTGSSTSTSNTSEQKGGKANENNATTSNSITNETTSSAYDVESLTWYGRGRVATSVFGYKQIDKKTTKVMATHPLELPLIERERDCFWLDIPYQLLSDNLLPGHTLPFLGEGNTNTVSQTEIEAATKARLQAQKEQLKQEMAQSPQRVTKEESAGIVMRHILGIPSPVRQPQSQSSQSSQPQSQRPQQKERESRAIPSGTAPPLSSSMLTPSTTTVPPVRDLFGDAPLTTKSTMGVSNNGLTSRRTPATSMTLPVSRAGALAAAAFRPTFHNTADNEWSSLLDSFPEDLTDDNDDDKSNKSSSNVLVSTPPHRLNVSTSLSPQPPPLSPGLKPEPVASSSSSSPVQRLQPRKRGRSQLIESPTGVTTHTSDGPQLKRSRADLPPLDVPSPVRKNEPSSPSSSTTSVPTSLAPVSFALFDSLFMLSSPMSMSIARSCMWIELSWRYSWYQSCYHCTHSIVWSSTPPFMFGYLSMTLCVHVYLSIYLSQVCYV
jgi:hypothetical protein